MNQLKSQTPILGTSSTVGEFWAWAYSDVLNNSNRGVFAEYLVGTALDAVYEPRLEWDGYDLLYHNKKIEVKSSAYIQSWQQAKLSTIRFDIAPKKAWDARTNTYNEVVERASDCYVFALFTTLDKSQANVLDTEQWRFYTVSTQQLDENFPNQKSFGLSKLQALSNEYHFNEIKMSVDRILKL